MVRPARVRRVRRAPHWGEANGSRGRGVRKDRRRVNDRRRARPPQTGGADRSGKAHPGAAAGLGGEGRNNNGVAQERRAETSRNDVGAARRRHCIRITFSRLKATGKWNSGPTSEPPSRPPEPLLNNKPNPVSPAACWTRKYVPDPARSTPLRFTALPA